MATNTRANLQKRTPPNKRPPNTGSKSKKNYRKSKSKFLSGNLAKLCVALTVVIAVFFVFLLYTVITTLSYDKVYDGLFLNKVSVAHMTREELTEYINTTYSQPLNNIVINIKAGDKTWPLHASDLKITFNKDQIVDYVYEHGHTGNVFQRLSDINNIKSNGKNIDVWEDSIVDTQALVTYDEAFINDLATKIAAEAKSSFTEHKVNIDTIAATVSVTAGNIGYSFDSQTVKSAILEAVNKFKSAELDLLDDSLKLTNKIYPAKLDIDACVNQINRQPVDASYKTSADHKTLQTQESQYGLSVDRAELEAVNAKLTDPSGNYTPGETFNITVTKIAPNVKPEDLKKATFNDVLGEATTSFSGSATANRNINLKVGTAAFNGYILAPGEQFSFNSVVKNTPKEDGYREAGAYSDGGVKNSYGGGICQVSTTLYNAVIRSVNVNVDTRRNHTYKVSYIDGGFDCMISYGSSDFLFTNKTSYPIKIQGIFDPSGKKLTFKILGVNEFKNVKFEFSSKKLYDTPYKTVSVKAQEDAQSGIAGGRYTYTRETYVDGKKVTSDTVLVNGKTVYSKALTVTSTYRAMDRRVYTKPATSSPAQTPVPSTPSGTSAPNSSDSANPSQTTVP